MIPHSFGSRSVTSLLGANFTITPNNSLPGSSQVTSFLGGIEQWSFAVLSVPATEQRRRGSSSRRAGEYVEQAVDDFRVEWPIRRHR